MIHSDDAAAVKDEMWSAVQEHRRFQLTYRLRTAARAERWVSDQGQGVFSPDGELTAIEGFITDITERKRSD